MHDLRADIVELFSEAQNILRDQSRARHVEREVWHRRRRTEKRELARVRVRLSCATYTPPPIPPAPTVGATCLYCAAPSERVVVGFALCERHARHRERFLWGRQKSPRLQGAV